MTSRVNHLSIGGETLLRGTVQRWLDGRGYGFIKPDEGTEDILVHHSEVQGAYSLREGQRVEFDVQRTDRGPRA
ncbi:MAG: cold-shock protein, partial [Candidatus Bathyarchaeia archaeon]